jgi:glycosyltransferase involved in cell wall biosynthesis
LRIQVITSRYPNEKEPYNHMFVHTRNIQYLKYGHEVKVYIPSKEKSSYQIDGIKVYLLPVNEIIKNIGTNSIVMIHLLYHSFFKELDGGIIYDYLIKNDMPTLFFIHGIEVQSIWKSRREDIKIFNPKSIARFVYRDFYLLPKMAKTFSQIMLNTKNIKFIAVSKWMRQETEKTLGIEIEPKTIIIPNGVDTKLFSFKDHWLNRYKLLTIRPLSFKGKYAVDLAINTMFYISSDNVNLTIYGKGKDENRIRAYVMKNKLDKKVIIKNSFIPHNKIPEIHSEYGIYYGVTRMDAQGVSMCEAMASGMPVISFNTCAIPEFIKDGENGLLVNNFDLREAAEKIESLIVDKNLFTKISENGRKSMEKIDIEMTTKKELMIAKELL